MLLVKPKDRLEAAFPPRSARRSALQILSLLSIIRGMPKKSENLWTVAYFLSRFGTPNLPDEALPPARLGVNSWGEAYMLFFDTLRDGRDAKVFYILSRDLATGLMAGIPKAGALEIVVKTVTRKTPLPWGKSYSNAGGICRIGIAKMIFGR
jgi:hypothetical protein